MKRISKTDIDIALITTKLKLVRGFFYRINSEGFVWCGCPLTILYACEHSIELGDLTSNVLEWSAKEYGRNYSFGFRCGFDGGKAPTIDMNEDLILGWKDGRQLKEEYGL